MLASRIKEGTALVKDPAECETQTLIALSVSKTPFKTNTGSCGGISKSITDSISEQEMIKKEINRIWGLGKNIIFDIDVIGGLKIKKKYPNQTLSIFLKTPNINDIEKRLIKRNLD